MWRFLLRKAMGHAVLWLVAASLVYLLACLALDPRGNYAAQQPAPPEDVVDATLQEYNLNDKEPLAQRYAVWIGGVLRGDLGHTWDGTEVTDEVMRRVGVSLRLLTLGFAVGVASGAVTAIAATLRPDGWFDRMSGVGAMVLLSVPAVVVALSLENIALWFNATTGVEVFRFTGEFRPDVEGTARFLDRVQHLVLPTLTVALPVAALLTRYQRGLLADAAESEYVRSARARGLTRRRALVRHALRVALLPLFTFAGLTLAGLFTGVVFAETVFGWHGVGAYLIDSITSGDVNSVAAVGCLTAAGVVLVSFAGDMAHGALDPRIRES